MMMRMVLMKMLGMVHAVEFCTHRMIIVNGSQAQSSLLTSVSVFMTFSWVE